MPASELRGAHCRRLFHDDEAGGIEGLDKPRNCSISYSALAPKSTMIL
jgi:hypothetical protein